MNEDIILNQKPLSIKDEIFFYFFEELKKYDYDIIKLINKSNISKIFLARNIKKNIFVTLKVIEKNYIKKFNYESIISQITKEENILKICKSDNILNLYQKIETDNFIIFEYEYIGISLAEYMEYKKCLQYNDDLFEDLLLEISDFLKVLFKNGIIHRDIKPTNIFMNKEKGKLFFSTIKLGGFGCATYIKDNTSEQIGSIFYTAPEIIKKLPYNEKCDLFSLGVTLYEIYYGESPYGKKVSDSKILYLINSEEIIYFKNANESKYDIFFKKLLTVNSKNRMTYKEFFDFTNNIEKEIKDFKEKVKNQPFTKAFSIPINLTENMNKLELKEKRKKKELFLNYDKFECLDDDNVIALSEEDEKILGKIIDIVKEEKLPDIMSIPNGNIDNKDKITKFNNIIYYDENIDFIKSINKDSDVFEEKTSGSFFLCSNLDSLNLIKDEIIKMNDENISFNLIITGSTCEKIMKFLEINKEFDNYINNICIYCILLKKYQHLKQKYPKIHNDIYNKRKDIINFIERLSKENIKPFPTIKLITYKSYISKYKERHEKISQFYGDLNSDSYNKQFSSIEHLILEESINKELRQKDTNKLIEGFLSFDIKKDLEALDESIIKEYTGNNIYKDLNKWLLNFDKKCYESIAYFTARLMYSLNSYGLKNGLFYNQNEKVLYKGMIAPYSSLLPYEKAKGKIILLTNFTSTSEDENIGLKFSKRNDPSKYKDRSLFSVIYYITNYWKDDLIPSGINIQKLAKFKNEKEILFQPFSFYKVNFVKIDISNFTADIYLETIGKKDILEIGIKKGKRIYYDEKNDLIQIEN